MEKLLEDVSFEAEDRAGETVVIDGPMSTPSSPASRAIRT
jgi:ATP-dependent protease HslVU (ClpYQ) ATPase subunit